MKDGDNNGRKETEDNGMDEMDADMVEEEAVAGKFLPFLMIVKLFL